MKKIVAKNGRAVNRKVGGEVPSIRVVPRAEVNHVPFLGDVVFYIDFFRRNNNE